MRIHELNFLSRLYEWYMIFFRSKSVSYYHIFLPDDSYLIRRGPITEDADWWDNSHRDRYLYYNYGITLDKP